MAGMIDVTGQRFNRFVVLEFVRKDKNSNWWRVRCDCGKEKVLRKCDFVYGATKSCGCLRAEERARGVRWGRVIPVPTDRKKPKGIKGDALNIP